jgi:hypothetical protein
MAHVFSGTLAGLAFVLAFVLNSGFLFLTAALLAVLAGVTQLFFWRKRSESSRPSYRPIEPRDELSDLGILEIRPKQKVNPVQGSGNGVLSGPAAAPKSKQGVSLGPAPANQAKTSIPVATGEETIDSNEADVPPSRGRTEGARGGGNGGASSGDGAMVAGPDEIPLTVRPVTDQEYSVRYANPALDSRVILPCLEALSAAAGSQTACLLERIDNSLRHRILAIASRSDYARSGGQYTVMVPYVGRNARPGSVHVRSYDKDLDSSLLRYYSEHTSIHSLAAVPLARNEVDAHILLCDSRRSDAFASKDICALIAQFARTIDHVLAPPAGNDDEIMAVGVRAIEEEMLSARSENNPLALALVHLNQSGTHGDFASGYMSVENRLLEQLRDSDPAIRIERLSTYTYGVFYVGTINDVEDWAVTFETQIESDPVIGHTGVSIGVAMLADRHETADEFRIDAMAALEEAFESGACTILE